MKNLIYIFIGSIISLHSYANYLDENLQRLNWNGVEVIYLEDDTSPLFDISIYFGEGASFDKEESQGQTNLAFNLLTSGTPTLSQKVIADRLDFYAISYSPNITHEYVTYNISGLTDNAKPAMNLICSVFNKANYPGNELNKLKTILTTNLKNLKTNHSELANRVFREISLRGTGFDNPVDGRIETINNITSKNLIDTLEYFNQKVYKKIYIKGPKAILSLKETMISKCGWGKVEKKLAKKSVEKGVNPNVGNVFVLPVPNANQAQIRIGSYIPTSFTTYKPDLQSFTKKFLGGGFTSQLMQELRVKRGLTYSASAFLGSQKAYGRSGIMTFTKNETLVKTLDTIQEVLKNNSQKIDFASLERSKRYTSGNYLFSLESSSAFLSNLIFFDHIGRDFSEIYEFQKNIKNIKAKDVQSIIKSVFSWKEQVTLIVGDKSVVKELKKSGYKPQVIDIERYL